VRRRGPRPLQTALDRITAELAPATLLAEVQRAWAASAGQAFAAQSEPVSERDGVITVACSSAVWAQELDLLSERVVERLNGELGRPAVRALRPQARQHHVEGDFLCRFAALYVLPHRPFQVPVVLVL
jgi:predicted nucleic acid-binding Zn ribbon protein